MPRKYFDVIVSFAAVVLVAVFFVAAPITSVVYSQREKSPAKNSKRDLSLYELGKTYDFGWGNPETLRAERDEFRQYLWQQWSRQLRTKVTATFYTMEGDPTTSTYYIEPGRNGRWHIAVDSEQDCCLLYAQMKPKKERELRKFSETFTELERVEAVQAEAGRFSRWRAIKTDRELPPQRYMLRLRKAGRESAEVL